MNETKADGSCCTPVRGAAAADIAVAKAPVVTSDVTAEMALCEIVEIPGGRALVGTDHPENPVDEEGPLRQVRIKPFWMDVTAVTNARFAAFVDDTGYQTEAERLGDSFVFKGLLPPETREQNAVAAAPWWRMVKGASWRCIAGPDQPMPYRPDDPVVHVSWTDACAFAKWAGGRLPNEAEWEHAARGGLGDVKYPWGDQDPDETAYFPCNIWQGTFPTDNQAKDSHYGTAPVASFAPNGYGLYQMCGNVWEWTSQNFKTRSLSKQIRHQHADKKGHKITKGGSFLCHNSYCYRYRIAARTGNSPDSSTSHTGFRLVYDKDPQLGVAAQ